MKLILPTKGPTKGLKSIQKHKGFRLIRPFKVPVGALLPLLRIDLLVLIRCFLLNMVVLIRPTVALYCLVTLAYGSTDIPESEHGIHLQFCSESSGAEGLKSVGVQPKDQMEVFEKHSVNRTHFALDWRANSQLCGRNVTSYYVDVISNSPVVNLVLTWFGSFPQSTCGSQSKTNNKVRTQDGKVPESCSPYALRCDEDLRSSTIALPPIVWMIARWSNLQIRVRSWGELAEPELCHAEPAKEEEGKREKDDAGAGGELGDKALTQKSCGYSTTNLTPVVFHCIIFKSTDADGGGEEDSKNPAASAS